MKQLVAILLCGFISFINSQELYSASLSRLIGKIPDRVELSELLSGLVYVTIEKLEDSKETPSASIGLQSGAYGFTREYVLTPATDILTNSIPKTDCYYTVPQNARITYTDQRGLTKEIKYASYLGNYTYVVLRSEMKRSSAPIDLKDMNIFGGFVDKRTDSALLAGWSKNNVPLTKPITLVKVQRDNIHVSLNSLWSSQTDAYHVRPGDLLIQNSKYIGYYQGLNVEENIAIFGTFQPQESFTYVKRDGR